MAYHALPPKERRKGNGGNGREWKGIEWKAREREGKEGNGKEWKKMEENGRASAHKGWKKRLLTP